MKEKAKEFASNNKDVVTSVGKSTVAGIETRVAHANKSSTRIAMQIDDLQLQGFQQAVDHFAIISTSKTAVRYGDVVMDDRTVEMSAAMLIKGKIIIMHLYSGHRNDADMTWVLTSSSSWANAIRVAN